MSLIVKNLQVISSNHKLIIDRVNFVVDHKELVVLEGQNGSGKSTLARALAGDPSLMVTGFATLDNVDLLTLPVNKRSGAGLFLSFQNPVELPNISVASFLKAIYWAKANGVQSVDDFAEKLEEYLHFLRLPVEVLSKNVNQDFSGGEKKRLELLQLLLLAPKYAILDEIDSGVDKDSLELLMTAINYCRENFKTGFLIITHYQKFLDLSNPSKRLVLKNGIVIEEREE